jgi:hypothetical protein
MKEVRLEAALPGLDQRQRAAGGVAGQEIGGGEAGEGAEIGQGLFQRLPQRSLGEFSGSRCRPQLVAVLDQESDRVFVQFACAVGDMAEGGRGVEFREALLNSASFGAGASSRAMRMRREAGPWRTCSTAICDAYDSAAG